MMNGKKDDFGASIKQVGALMTIPIILLIGPVVGYFFGMWIDRKTQLYPWFTTIFILLGFTGSAREVIRLLKQISKDNETKGP